MMTRALRLLLCLALHGASLGAAPVALFNGQDLSGWRPVLVDEAADSAATFAVTDEGNLRISGTPKGYLRSVGAYSNYRLIVEWRWVDGPGNSGVLVHTQGVDAVWPRCIEAQLRSDRAGSIIFMGLGAGGVVGGDTFLVDGSERPNRQAPLSRDPSEKPLGEWNRYEIIAAGTSLQLYVNGVLQNESTQLTLDSGAICLQSEGAPIEFRRIELLPLDDAN